MSRFFEDFAVGEVIKHQPGRTVTETDNLVICALTMNPQPLHVDHEFAAKTQFGRPLVNGLLTLSLTEGLSVYDLSLDTMVAHVGVEDAKFLKPTFFGDTIFAETEVLEKLPAPGRSDAGIVRFEHRGVNQRNEVVVLWRDSKLMRRREKA